MALQILKRRIIRHSDNVGQIGFDSMRLPKLKGHVKITLHNCRTGKNEIYEGENIITNAVSDIFANNYLGGIGYSNLMPLWSKWYGGILAYKEPHADATDPTDYFIKGDDVNEVIAHAGDTAPSSASIVAEDLKRGSPLSITHTENSVTQTWEWGGSQGNGVISALSLCHKDLGNAGTGCTSSAFQAFSPFSMIQGSHLPASNLGLNNADNLFARYDDYHGLFFTIGDVGEFRYGRHTSFATKKLTIYIRRLPYFKAGLHDAMHADNTYQRVFTVETTGANMYAQPSYFFDIATKYLWVFYNNTSTCGSESGSYWWAGTWSKNTVSYFVVDCENEQIIDEGTIVSDTDDLVPLSLPQSVGAGSEYTDFYVNACIVKDGNYVYFPTGSMAQYWQDTNSYYITGYKKININNQAEQSAITFNSTQRAFLSATKIGGLIINSGRVVNNGVGYTCSQQINEGNRAFNDVGKVSFLAMPIGVGNESGTRTRYLVANKMVNTSLFNLNAPVQKTTTKSMQIEYTLQEVEE